MNTPKWLLQENQEYRINTEKRFRDFYSKFKDNWNAIDKAFKMAVSNAVRSSKVKSGMEMEKLTFDQWIFYIQGLK